MKDIFEIQDNIGDIQNKTVLKFGNSQNESKAISIIIPVYNRFECFKRAIHSALSQKCSISYSIIVTDNNYENNIDNINAYEKYIKSLNSDIVLYYKNKENIGAANNFNLGPRICKSEYFVMCHEDDELPENCLDELWKFKKTHNVKKQLVLPYNQMIEGDSIVKSPQIRTKFKRLYNHMNMIDWFLSTPTNGCGCLINRQAFLELGGYNPEYNPSGDYALFTLYTYIFGAFRLKKCLYIYHVSSENDSNKVFYTCIERDEFFRNCIKEKIPLPNFILNRIIKANKKRHTEIAEKIWLKKIIHPAPKIDKIIMKIADRMNRVLHVFW